MLLVYLKYTVTVRSLIVLRHLLLHQKLEFAIVNREEVFPLDQNEVHERWNWAHIHLQLVNLFKAVLGSCIYRVYKELFLSNYVKGTIVRHFNFWNFTIQIVIAYFFSVEVEKTYLSFGNRLLCPEYWVRLSWVVEFWKCHCDNSVKRVKFQQIKAISPHDFSFFNLLLLILNKWAPSKNVLFEFILGLFKKNESHCVFVTDYSRLNVDFVLKL